MNDTATVAGGYVGSKMFTTHLLRAAAAIKAAFGEDHIQVQGAWLCNAVTDGVETGGAWFNDRVCDLMSEEIVFGYKAQIYASRSDNKQVVMARTQFPAFIFNPQLIQNTNGYLS